MIFGAAKFADRYVRMPYARNVLARAAAFSRYGRVSDSGFALTLLMTVPLIPIDAFARA